VFFWFGDTRFLKKMSLSELPEDVLTSIFGHTSPWDAMRLAGVCSSFKRAAESNTLWQSFLPCDYETVLAAVGSENPTKKEIVMSLVDGVFLDFGMQKYMLLPRSRGVCRKLSVAAMDVAWGQDMRFWRWEQSRSSCFGKVAHLLAVCWLEVTGTWSCSLPPGSYTAVWRLRVANPQGGRFYFLSWKCPLTFSIATADGQVLERSLNLSHVPGTAFEEWFEFEVGDIRVPKGKEESSSPPPPPPSSSSSAAVHRVDLEYGIREIDCTYWKGGLFLDCLTLRPSGCCDEGQPAVKDREPSKIRGQTGVF